MHGLELHIIDVQKSQNTTLRRNRKFQKATSGMSLLNSF